MNNTLVESFERAVLTLYADGELGYVPASDEWVGGSAAVPLPEEWQHAAQKLLDAGRLPEFEKYQETR